MGVGEEIGVAEFYGGSQPETEPCQDSPRCGNLEKASQELLGAASEGQEQALDNLDLEEALPSPSAFSKGPTSLTDSIVGSDADWRNIQTFSPTFSHEWPSASGSEVCEEDNVGRSARAIGESAVLKKMEWKISNTSSVLAAFLKKHEDDGGNLKEPDAVEARKEVEKVLLESKAIIQSKQYKKSAVAQLRAVFKDGKVVYQECILRLSMYEASLATQRSVYCAMVAQSDPAKLKARRRLAQCITDLAGLINRAPRRFLAARRDKMHAQTALKMLDSNWLMDLKQRCGYRPHWVPDSSAAKCADCKSTFTLLRSRHHCRACGMVFCESCSQWALPLPALAYFTEQRTCKMCYREHATHMLGRHGGQKNIDWSLVAADIAKCLPKAKPLLALK